MIRRGKHVSPRARGRETRLVGRAVPLALALVLVMAAVALGSHRDPSIAFSANPVTVGTEVIVTATFTGAGEGSADVHIDQCLDAGAPRPFEACDEGTAVWTLRKTDNGTATFEYTPTAAGQHGFQARTAHDVDMANLTVNPATDGQRHNGCNGLEVALTKVKPGGKAEAKLMELATSSKFDCDVDG